MMDGKNFTQEDVERFTEFLNFIAQKAIFNGWKTEDTIKHFKLLSYMQTQVLPKMKEHILEVVEVVEDNSDKQSEE